MSDQDAARIQDVYEDPKIVDLYDRQHECEPPERGLMHLLGAELARMDMLDIGVGAGRTARHFGPAVRSYLGVDYSAGMIERCRLRFPQFSFAVGDARRLDFVKDGSTDLVMFSFCGIDNADAGDRALILCEMVRVLRPGGVLVVSSHNTNDIGSLLERYRFKFSLNPRQLYRSLYWWIVFFRHNPHLAFGKLGDMPRVFTDSHDYRSEVTYIRPAAQVAALRALGLVDIRCAERDSETYVECSDHVLARVGTAWLHYFARKPAA